MAMAIDKAGLVDRILGGYGTVGSTIVVPTVPFWRPHPIAIPFDIQGANDLLDGAGYTDSDGDGIRNMPGGCETWTSGSSTHRVARRDPGREVDRGLVQADRHRHPDQAVTDSKLIDSWYALDYDVYIWGWGPDPDPDFILSTFTTEQCGVWSDTVLLQPRL